MTSNIKGFPLLGSAALLLLATPGGAEESKKIEEIEVVGRLKSSAENIIIERRDHEAVTDLMSAEMISRVGDSTVATALRRVTGVTLVEDKFIYVRGLGERYSSTLLNGASVPSPDLTRSVLPLDIFPASLVENLAVQKSYSPDLPAAFGGGNVDIRSTGLPQGLVFNMELGTGYNSETSGSGFSYSGGDDDWLGSDDGTRKLPSEITAALNEYQGNISANNIFSFLRRQNPSATFDDAQAINRGLATQLHRDISITDEDYENVSGQVNLGNRFYLENGMEFGFLGGISYDQQFETTEIVSREYSNPEEWNETETKSTRSVNITSNLNFGFRLNEDQEISTTSLFLRNTDDDAIIADSHNDNRPFSSGVGFRNYDIRFEEREIIVNQIKGTHVWGAETRDLLGLHWLHEKFSFLDELRLDWYYSDSDVDTQIPSEVSVSAVTSTNPDSGAVLASSVRRADSMATYRYTDLEDEVLSQGWKVTWPFYWRNFTIELIGGGDYTQKTRVYRQTDLLLGSTTPVVSGILDQPLSDIFSEDNLLNDDFGFALNISSASARSYLAATTNDAAFFKADVTWNDTWRVIAGVRYEDYIQVGLPWDPLVYSTDGTKGQISMDPQELRDAVFVEDDYYPAFSVIYMTENFWAETFQLRFGYSETIVRPDLREIADISYQDPLTGALVFGNPDVVPSSVDSYDVRAEWFFSNGDNLTLSLFYKDIIDPIEFFERAASDTKVASEVINLRCGNGMAQGVKFSRRGIQRLLSGG